jgi:hypothetical protein
MRISMRVVCTGAVLALTTGVSVSAHGQIHGCVGPSGTVRIVPTPGACKSNETALDWNVTGPQGQAGPAGPQGEQGPQGETGAPGAPGSGGTGGGPRVFNANGEDLGPLLGPGTVLLTLPNGRKSYALVDQNVPVDTFFLQFYTELNCGGDPYVAWSSVEELVPLTVLAQSGAWAIQPGTTAQRAVKSFRSVTDAGVSATCTPMTNSVFTSRFDFYTLQQLKLIAPFSVQ